MIREKFLFVEKLDNPGESWRRLCVTSSRSFSVSMAHIYWVVIFNPIASGLDESLLAT